MRDRPGRPWLLALVLVVITAGVAVALLTSQSSGTDAANVGDSGRGAPPEEPEPDPAEEGDARSCKATRSNPGGTNNYIPDAPGGRLARQWLRDHRPRPRRRRLQAARGRPRTGLARHETGGEQDNRASVRTDGDGRYRIETDPTVPQFGEPNIHVGYDDGDYREVFIRRVVDLDDKRAVVDLTLRR